MEGIQAGEGVISGAHPEGREAKDQKEAINGPRPYGGRQVEAFPGFEHDGGEKVNRDKEHDGGGDPTQQTAPGGDDAQRSGQQDE